jgi:Mn-dependent DtxR family transcriptional regulator
MLTGDRILYKIYQFYHKEEIHMKNTESAENYLETILILSQKLPVVRSIDVATELGFKKPSVSVAMKHLREAGHIVVSDKGYITLTETGREIADMIYERHNFLSSWLISLGVDEKIAVEDACRIEHVISKESFAAIKDAVGGF